MIEYITTCTSFHYGMFCIAYDFLEENSTERMVLELRFIDCKGWAAIEKEMHLSRSSLFSYQDKGLDKLLTYKKVRQILREYKKEV